MDEKHWSVRSLDMYYPAKRTNLAAALSDLLTLRGVSVRLIGETHADSFVVASGRQHPLSFIIDPQEVLASSARSRRPMPGRYFVYVTQELPRKGGAGWAAWQAAGWGIVLKDALCVYATFPQIVEAHAKGCTTQVLPPPPTAFMDAHGISSDVVFCGVPDERQRRILALLRKKRAIRCTQDKYGGELSSSLARARVVVMPCADGARLLPVCDLSEVLLSGAIVVAEAPLLAGPRLYDDRVIYIQATDDLDELASQFGTAVTAAMLGRKSSTSTQELLRLETALLYVTQVALDGLGRPGPLPAFLTAVREWLGATSIHAGIRMLCRDPASWRSLETRTLVDLARSIPPLHVGTGQPITTICMYSGDPEACVASVRAVTAAFPQHRHAVVCSTGSAPPVSDALAAMGATHVQVIGSGPAKLETPGEWRMRVRSRDFWVGLDAEYVLLYSDALLLRSAPLETFTKYDLVQHSASDDMHVCFVNVASVLRTRNFGTTEDSPEFIPARGLHAASPSISAALSAALFPSEFSVVPGPAAVRPPGVRIALIDSAMIGSDGPPGKWAASIAMGLLTILGSQLTVFSALPANMWVTSILDAWGERRQLHGLTCLPHSSTSLLAQDEFDLLIDIADFRGPTVRRRMARIQWLVYTGGLRTIPPWWRPKAMRSVFHRVILGCVAHFSRVLQLQGTVENNLALVPSPSYETALAPSAHSGLKSHYACVVRNSDRGRWIARAFQRAALGPTARLTILLQADDPAILAEIQGITSAGTRVVIATDERTRLSVLTDVRHAILLQGPAADGSVASDVLEALRSGCIPLWSAEAAAADVLNHGVHGAEFATEADMIRIMHAAHTGAVFQTKEGLEDCIGMVSLHTPVVLRQALMSVLLGGKGIIDTGLLHSAAGNQDDAGIALTPAEDKGAMGYDTYTMPDTSDSVQSPMRKRRTAPGFRPAPARRLRRLMLGA